jgi:hypothetical protein
MILRRAIAKKFNREARVIPLEPVTPTYLPDLDDPQLKRALAELHRLQHGMLLFDVRDVYPVRLADVFIGYHPGKRTGMRYHRRRFGTKR